MLHALDDADRLVVHGSVRIATVVGHPVEHRGEHPLEHRARHVGPDAAVQAQAEAVVPVARAGQVDLVGVGEHRGIAVGHGPGQPYPLALLELGACDLAVRGDRAPVTRRRGVEAQELLGRRVEQRAALAAEPLPLGRVLGQPLERVCGQRGRGVEPAADEQGDHPEQFHVGRLLAVDLRLRERVDHARSRVPPDLRELAEHVLVHGHLGLPDARNVRRVRWRVDGGVHRLAVDAPVLQRDSEHRQGENGGHDVGEVIDEVDLAGLDLLVQAGADQFVDDRGPAADRGGRQVRVERLAVVPLRRRVHLKEAALDLHVLGRGDRDALVAAPLVVHVMVVGQVLRGPGDLEDLVVPGDDPVAVVGVAPCDRALAQHLGRDLLELLPVLGGMAIEVITVLLAVSVVVRDGFRGHELVSLRLALRE